MERSRQGLRSWTVGLLMVAVAARVGAVEPPSASSNRALLVGISNYQNHPKLRGATQDVALMRNVLLGRFNFRPENITTLTDQAATGAAVRAALGHLAEQATEETIVVVHFSGLGGQLPDDGKEELDGLDETIAPVDAATSGVGEIRDDELDKLIDGIARKTKKLTVVLDTCYVSSATRDGAAGRCISRNHQQRALLSKGSHNAYAPSSRRTPQYNLLSAAQSLQIASEAVLGVRTYGAFTYELASALLNEPGTPSFQTITQRVGTRVRARFPSQQPLFSIRDPQAPMFHDGGMRREFAASLMPGDKGMVTVSAGQFHGLARGTRLQIYPPGTQNFDATAAIATLEVTQPAELSSAGKLSGTRSIPANAIARRAFVTEDSRLSVWVETGPTGARAELARLRQRLLQNPRIAVVEGRSNAQLQLVAWDDGFAILAGDLTPLKSGIRTTGGLNAALSELAHWFTLLQLNNPSSALTVDLDLRRSKSEEPLRGAVRPGDVIEYTVTNTSAKTLYAHVLLMSSDGSINTSAAKPVEIGSGASYRQRLGTFLPDDRQEVTDYIKVFAAPMPLDLLLLASRNGHTEALKNVDWTTHQVSYDLRRQGTRVSAFAVHMNPKARSADSKSEDQHALCAGEGECFAARELNRDGSLIVVDATSARSLADDMRPGAAFEEAYEMQQRLGAERVEPLFDIALGTDLPGIEGRSGNGGENDAAAAGDKGWSLDYVHAPAAWAAIQRETARPHGREAQGIAIAHLDTGYREHPELLHHDGDFSTVLTQAGLDLVDGGEPYDTLSTSGAFPNPGHGTASGSVIASWPGCQLKRGDEPCITGIAPGAQLVPIRVNTSVVVLNQRRLAEAIWSVVDGRVGGRPRIISIAMGGPPSWTLWRAVKAAEAAGIIIVAAAGNNVGTVVWPARFDAAIAAGAINIRCRPWNGSSHGPRVDIAAPGESVWRAQVDRERQTDIIGMGTGTTFATAITTGAAALWVAKHEKEAEFNTLASAGGLTEAFRRSIQATAWQPVASDTHRPKTYCDKDVGWDSKEDGAGILNVERMLTYPLDGATARAAPRTESPLPLFETVYPRGTAPERVVNDYEQLFPPNKRQNIRQFESEVMFQYAVNDTVRTTIDRIMAGAQAAAEYDNARKALLLADLSEPLRQRLQP